MKSLCIILTLVLSLNLAADPEQQHITLIIPSFNNASCYERNLDTALAQDYPNYDIIYLDDCSTDNTGLLVLNYIDTHPRAQEKITFIHNTYNRKAMANIFRAVHMCPNDDLVVLFDGDDFLIDEHALSFIQEQLVLNNALMSYAQYKNVPEEMAIAQKIPVLGYAKPTPPELIQSGDYRNFKGWCWSGLRAFYAGLFKRIKIEDLMFTHDIYAGKFFPTSYDGAIMYPMLEMCGTQFIHIPEILLLRNIDTPLNDFKIHRELQRQCGIILRSLTPYTQLIDNPTDILPTGNAELIITASTEELPDILAYLNTSLFDSIHILPKAESNLEEYELLLKIRNISHSSQASYIMIADASCTDLSVERGIYWLSHSSAAYIPCLQNILDPALSIAQQPLEHLEENLYALCTRHYATADYGWCGLFRKNDLERYLADATSLEKVHHNIVVDLTSQNRSVICAA